MLFENLTWPAKAVAKPRAASGAHVHELCHGAPFVVAAASQIFEDGHIGRERAAVDVVLVGNGRGDIRETHRQDADLDFLPCNAARMCRSDFLHRQRLAWHITGKTRGSLHCDYAGSSA